jgi:hypothetical protein
MPEIDELDRIWRAGLSAAAAARPPVDDPSARVGQRVRRRRRSRITLTTVGAVALVGIVAVAAVFATAPRGARVATSPPAVTVDVVVGPALQIHFPGLVVTGQPPRVHLPRGLLRFRVRAAAGTHELVIDGVHRFDVTVASETSAVSVTVRLAPGVYRMHCTIPGHTIAGEEATLLVD